MKNEHLKTSFLGLVCITTSLALAQPIITQQPVDRFVTVGQRASFTVTAIGAPPLTYQWFFNSAPLPSATNSTVQWPNIPPSQWGYYSVVVSNSFGSVTSSVVELKAFMPAPHNLNITQPQTGDGVLLSFSGGTSPTFAPYFDIFPLETSTNLVDWTPLAVLERTNSALLDGVQFPDSEAPKFQNRFYRTPTNTLPTFDIQPTGPHAVGTFSLLLTNNLRAPNSKFMVTFWYPAMPAAGVLPAKYVDPQVAYGELNSYYNFTSSGGGNFGSQAQQFFSHSYSNAPVANNQAQYPIILYQPGAGGHRRENTDKTEDLASWGYVVVGMDARDTALSVFPNGGAVEGGFDGSTIASVRATIEARFLDLQFVRKRPFEAM
jgi:Immunoglobulin I-set domain/Platelet-activating factor acetylhydrolase, isoform II